MKTKLLTSRKILSPLSFFISLIFLSNCSEPVVPGGNILIKNDILDKEYNSFLVDQVVTKHGLTGFRETIKPGEAKTLPKDEVRSFRVTRKYKDHEKIYQVSCPAGFNKQIKINLIDIHSNRIGGGCELTRRGLRIAGVVQWEGE